MGNLSKVTCKWNSVGKNVSKFNETFIKSYDENIDKGCIIEVDAEYPKRLHNFHND